MDATSLVNFFDLCWNVVLKESQKFKGAFFLENHLKIIDTRDTSFDIVENRLAYTYRFGCFNILFSEKCFSNFLKDCSESALPLENLKVCSLSNGPGFDIIGLICALFKANKPVKCFPLLNAVNVHEPWSHLYRTLINTSFEMLGLKSYFEHFPVLSPTNIEVIQGDIFSALSSEARYCISNSNVLLMVKAYSSTKATPDVVINSLEEIFSLLQPESLIFFIGSKKNMKLFSEYTNLSNHVKSIYGPQKVSLTNVPFDEKVANIIGMKPFDSGNAEFVVWQKKDSLNVEMKKRRSRKKKKNAKNTGDEAVINNYVNTNEWIDVPDSVSETIFASGSDEVKSDLFSNVSDSTSFDGVKSEISEKEESLSQNDNVDYVTASLKKINLQHEEHRETSDPDSKQSTTLLDELKSYLCSNLIDSTNLDEVKPKKISKKKVGVVTISKKTKKKKVQESSVSLNVRSTEQGTSSKMLNLNLLPKKISKKKVEVVTISKKSKNKDVQSANVTKDQSSNINAKKESKEQNLQAFFQENSLTNQVKYKSNIVSPKEINVQHPEENRLGLLIQRCDSLVTVLEKLTDDIKNICFSKPHQSFKKCSGARQELEKSENFHCSCSVNIIHSCNCGRVCNNKILLHNVCPAKSN